MVKEFDMIQQYFAPLSGQEAVGLIDDAAHYIPEQGKKIVISKDMLIETVHFIENTNPADLAWKALAVNISDLIAKGAKPKGYLLGLGLPKAADHNWLQAFSDGLQEAQSYFGISLFGGDSVKSQKGIILSVTVIGEADVKSPIRSGARDGDHIYITGSLGGSCFGLKSLMGEIEPNKSLETAYLRPNPPIDCIDLIQQFATASADISDGLTADLGHILKASNLNGAELIASDIPINDEITGFDNMLEILSWGDDYQTLFTVNPEKVNDLIAFHKGNCKTEIHKIGVVKKSGGIKLILTDDKILSLNADGFTHF